MTIEIVPHFLEHHTLKAIGRVFARLTLFFACCAAAPNKEPLFLWGKNCDCKPENASRMETRTATRKFQFAAILMALPMGGPVFQVGPHFYQTWWFYGLCAIAVMLVVVGGHSVRVKQLRASERALLLRAEERTRELQQEIANRIQAQSENTLQQHQFEKLFQNAPVGIVMLDRLDRIVAVNKAFEAIFQYKPEELLLRCI